MLTPVSARSRRPSPQEERFAKKEWIDVSFNNRAAAAIEAAGPAGLPGERTPFFLVEEWMSSIFTAVPCVFSRPVECLTRCAVLNSPAISTRDDPTRTEFLRQQRPGVTVLGGGVTAHSLAEPASCVMA